MRGPSGNRSFEILLRKKDGQLIMQPHWAFGTRAEVILQGRNMFRFWSEKYPDISLVITERNPATFN